MSAEPLPGLAGYVTIREASRILGKSAWQVRAALRRNRIASIRIGRVELVRLIDVYELGFKEVRS